MDTTWPYTGDTVEVTGLSVLLDEEETLPYLEVGLRCRGRFYRAFIMAAEEEWALSVRDESGRLLPGEHELYPTQSSAVLAAMLTALGTSESPFP